MPRIGRKTKIQRSKKTDYEYRNMEHTGPLPENKRNHFLTERAEYGYNSADGNKGVKARRN